MNAIEKIPDEILSDFNMSGLIDINLKYCNDCNDTVQAEINQNFNASTFKKYVEMAGRKEQNYYGYTDTWLYEAIKEYSIKDKSICIFGSANPWYEAIAISNNVKECVVIEYSKRPSFHKSIKYIRTHEELNKTFDIGWSISSFEHDGLGRYGDPLNGNADLEAMQRAKSIIKPDGLLFLAVPIGKDEICFNAHRIYGKIRFPYLIEGWEPIATFGFELTSFDNNYNGIHGTPYQPIIILKNTH